MNRRMRPSSFDDSGMEDKDYQSLVFSGTSIRESGSSTTKPSLHLFVLTGTDQKIAAAGNKQALKCALILSSLM